jgi:hypothetical protein
MAEEKPHKRKKLKIFLVALLVVLALIAAVAFCFLSMGRNTEATQEYKAELETQAEIQITEIVSDIDKATADVEAQVSSGGGVSGSVPEVSAEELLRAEYYGIMQKQKSYALASLAELFGRAKSDYDNLPATGKNKLELASEYLSMVKAMEAQMDAIMDRTTAEMYARMESMGLENRDTIIAEFKSEYKKVKEENRAVLWEKARGVL